MTDAAQHLLNQVCLANDLPLGCWEHFYTGVSDEGESVFMFDRPEMTLKVTRTGEGDNVEIVRADP